MDYKQDFGLYLKSNFALSVNKTIVITDSFFILNLVLYPDHTSTITAMFEDKVASLDFNDNILKVFIWSLTNIKLINRQDLEKQITNQTTEPIIISFTNNQVFISNMVLTCSLGQTTRSKATNEEFLPLIINSIKIV